MRLLLSAGAAVDQASKYGDTPLCAASQEGNVACVRQLLAAGAAVDQADKHSRTPLSCASTEGRVECVQLLLALGAAVDQADKDGRTPLYIASLTGKSECVQQLLAACDRCRLLPLEPSELVVRRVGVLEGEAVDGGGLGGHIAE